MPESSTSPAKLTAAQRQAEALKLRAKGMPFEAIAKELGYSGHAGAYKAVNAALRKTLQEPADELRKLEVERLDRMLEGLWDQAINGGTWQVDRVLNIMERRARLLGLDKPPDRDLSREVDSFLAGVNTVKKMQAEKDLSERSESYRVERETS